MSVFQVGGYIIDQKHDPPRTRRITSITMELGHPTLFFAAGEAGQSAAEGAEKIDTQAFVYMLPRARCPVRDCVWRRAQSQCRCP